MLPLAAAEAKKKVIIVEVTLGYRHSAIPTGEKVLQKLADESGAFEIVGVVRQPDVQLLQKPNKPKDLTATADDKAKAKYAADLKSYEEKPPPTIPRRSRSGRISSTRNSRPTSPCCRPKALNAQGIDAVVFNSTTGDLPLPDKQGFIDWIKAGHAFIGIHAATDTFHGFQPYIDMIGGEFDGHPWHQAVTVRVEDPSHPAAGSYREPVRGFRRDLPDEELRPGRTARRPQPGPVQRRSPERRQPAEHVL